MIRVSVREFKTLPPLPPRALKALERFDQQLASSNGGFAFDWRWRQAPRARSLCGVIALPGLEVEILPKIEGAAGEVGVGLGRRNLLYMLVKAGDLPFEERDLAELAAQKLPMFEALATVFASRLRKELIRGAERTYVSEEGERRFVKGKILFEKHARLHAAGQHRVFVKFDEHQIDSSLNRVLSAATDILCRLTTSTRTRASLARSQLDLAEVSKVPLTMEVVDRVQLNRNTLRFSPLVAFARLLAARRVSGISAGAAPSFSLLFPMESVFERFVGRAIQRGAEKIGLNRRGVHLQGKGHRLHLLREDGRGGRFLLRPDIVIERKEQAGPTIVDTKWKHLRAPENDGRYKLDQHDVYQLFAYAQRYEAPLNVLLFPKVPGARSRNFETYEAGHVRRLCVRFLDLSRDLRQERAWFQSELSTALSS